MNQSSRHPDRAAAYSTGPCFVIAEIGVNHNGDVGIAKTMIEVARDCGADAVKFQTFRAEELVSPAAPMAEYQARNLGETGSQLEMIRKLELSAEDFRVLRDHCRTVGIEFMSTPFDEQSADLLASLDVNAFKVSSGDLTHHEFLAHLARFGKPIILSSGMATLGDIEEALAAIEANGNPDVAILHCVSDYPARLEDCNLRAMSTIAQAFGKPAGWSDHTLGDTISLAAVALGARIIEKHFTLDRTMPGPDHKASLEASELKAMMDKIREIELALGTGRKIPTARERKTASVARRSLVTKVAIAKGTVITADMLTSRRPGTGLPPREKASIIGMRAAQDLPANCLIALDNLSGAEA